MGTPIQLACLEFTGNKRKADTYFRRRLKVREGDLLDMSRLEKSLKRLNSLKALHPVRSENVQLVVRENEKEADVVITLRERDRHRIGLSGESGGMFGTTLEAFYQLFDVLGQQDVLGGSLQGGPQVLNVMTNWAADRFLGLPLTLGTSFFFQYWQPPFPKLPGFPSRGGPLFSTRTVGAAWNTGVPVTALDTFGLRYSVEKVSGQPNLPGVGSSFGTEKFVRRQ